jgi:YggT family protein
MSIAGQVLEGLLFIFIVCLWVRFVIGIVQLFARSWHPRGPVLLVLEAVFSITDPPVRLVRRVLPTVRLGGVALDLSLWVVLIVAYVLQAAVRSTLL